MNGTSALGRLAFPLAAVLGAASLFFVTARVPASNPFSVQTKESARPAALKAPVMSACCQRIPTRVAAPPKYSVTFHRVDAGGVDYDAGGMLVEVVCHLTDLCAEQPVVGMSDKGIVLRMQTDT